MGRGNGEIVKVRAGWLRPLPVEFGTVLGDLQHLDLSGSLD